MPAPSRFIEAYYKTISEDIQQLHKYYATEAAFSHTENPNDEAVAVTGVDNIQQYVSKLDLPLGPGAVDLASGSVDVQSAGADGIMIAASGRMLLHGHSYPFSQSFLLVR